jgi:hypothetical protein
MATYTDIAIDQGYRAVREITSHEKNKPKVTGV